ncbi:MAG: hypothetical protein AB7U29_11205 [Desulfobulbus sp.]
MTEILLNTNCSLEGCGNLRQQILPLALFQIAIFSISALVNPSIYKKYGPVQVKKRKITEGATFPQKKQISIFYAE